MRGPSRRPRSPPCRHRAPGCSRVAPVRRGHRPSSKGRSVGGETLPTRLWAAGAHARLRRGLRRCARRIAAVHLPAPTPRWRRPWLDDAFDFTCLATMSRQEIFELLASARVWSRPDVHPCDVAVSRVGKVSPCDVAGHAGSRRVGPAAARHPPSSCAGWRSPLAWPRARSRPLEELGGSLPSASRSF